MSDLERCPFCGNEADIVDDLITFYGQCDNCGATSAVSSYRSGAIEAWNRRAQPAQAGHVPEASCGECGKKASDGWALYCVACMEEAGLPAVTDSPPLMHSCTSSLGKTPDSTAQAGQVLTDEEIDAAYEKARADYQRSRFAVRGQQLTAQDSPDWWFARAVEAAVLAKRVPQWLPIETAPKGQRVMVWIADKEAGENIAFAKVWFYPDGRVGGGAEGFNGQWDLTHWMPLPPPPRIVGEKGGA